MPITNNKNFLRLALDDTGENYYTIMDLSEVFSISACTEISKQNDFSSTVKLFTNDRTLQRDDTIHCIYDQEFILDLIAREAQQKQAGISALFFSATELDQTASAGYKTQKRYFNAGLLKSFESVPYSQHQSKEEAAKCIAYFENPHTGKAFPVFLADPESEVARNVAEALKFRIEGVNVKSKPGLS